MAQATQNEAELAAVMHCRILNPYVESSLREWEAQVR
jgi:hypothetical protein